MPAKEIRTLFVTIMSYPLRGGTHLRNWQNINIMRQFGEVGIFSVFNQDLQPLEDVDIPFWKHYNMDRESAWSDLVERGGRLLRRYGLRYFWAYSKRAANRLDQVIRDFKPGLIILEELGTYPFLAIAKAHHCPVIFDGHNVEAHLFRQIHCSQPTLVHWLKDKLHLPQIRSAESEMVRQTAQTWVCSDDDRQLIGQLYDSTSNVFVVPNAINVGAYAELRSGTYPWPKDLGQKSSNVLFLGNFYHPPNQEAADLLIEEVFPRLKQQAADTRMFLVGSNPTAKMLAAAQGKSNIIVTGEVPDVRPYLAAAGVMIVPLFKGGGTRFKILEAFAAGCPVVSTTKGAEGLGVEDGKHLLIADEVDVMIAGVQRIWKENDLRKRMVDAAYELVRSTYSWDAAAECVANALAHINKERSVG